MVSIYALAKYIGEDDDVDNAPKPIATTKPAKPSTKTVKGIDRTKPFRRPPPLGRMITAFRTRVIDTALQLQFQQALLGELETVALDRVAKPGRPTKSKTP